MKKVIVFLLILSSCVNNKDTLDHHLETGFNDYARKRPVNETLNDDIFVNDFVIYKIDSVTYKAILKVNNEVTEDITNKYTLAVHIFVNEKFLTNRKDYLLLDYKPEVSEYIPHKYLIKDFTTRAKRIDSIDFFLYDRDKYRKILGKKITIRNIGL